MVSCTSVLLVSLIASAMALPKNICKTYPYVLVTKEEWGGRPATSVTCLANPVPYVVIHHTYSPAACSTRETCNQAMRSMQDYHQHTQGWADIGYNFAVGGDNAVYEGRGWQAVGAHAVGYNTKSIGIAVIGDWSSELPPQEQLDVIKDLIAVGVALGYISEDYTLIGHRQVSSTECPGSTLFKEIGTWDRFSDTISRKH